MRSGVAFCHWLDGFAAAIFPAFADPATMRAVEPAGRGLMTLMTQALAEYVGITASRLSADAGAALRQAVRFGSDHFVAVLAALVAFVLGMMLLSGSRR
jgi:hypothetical protein